VQKIRYFASRSSGRISYYYSLVMMVNMLSVMSLVLPPAAVAALMATLYFIYPYPLVQGFNRYDVAMATQ